MMYPSAPWNLQGRALISGHFIQTTIARSFVPPTLEIVSILPGLTLGGVYFASYETGSVMEYNELIIVPALVRQGNQIGSWISHIYVDNEKSIAGGRNIWGLPKEWADFTWDASGVRASCDGAPLCSLAYPGMELSLPWVEKLPLSGRVLSQIESQRMLFESQFQGPYKIGRGTLIVPSTSPFASLKLGQPIVTVDCPRLHIAVNAPQPLIQV